MKAEHDPGDVLFKRKFRVEHGEKVSVRQVIVAFDPSVLEGSTGKICKVVVDASPKKNIKSIKPTSASLGAPTETVGWGFNPAKKGAKTAIANNAQGYSQGSGSLYVAKAGKRATKFAEGSGKAITKSTKPMKVVEEIQVAGKSQTQIQKELKDALKKAGSPAKGVGVKGKVKQVKAKSQTKKANKNSVV